MPRAPYRDSLKMLVLRFLAEEPMHGYKILKRVSELTGDKWKPAPGTLYPLLEQMMKEGLIEKYTVERGKVKSGERILYRLTEKGWKEFIDKLRIKTDALISMYSFILCGGLRTLYNNGYKRDAVEIYQTVKDSLNKLGESCKYLDVPLDSV
ncbi:MAG: PadR family transcriptional regulator [Desulfurococcales archaeon]|nr:PadR family transcriptional regulator [Desulfurococcales archaeon]MEB3758468.1 PadR family transcriptional regulator [Desulfurococcales archaeon]MEB3772842.1 PadR family transcriptional regulator [Desulfurococcales archaeon]MEB3786703.1 PadR family transcriptional regulator [Desulfurococcales archaeon]MEB3799522.1 PadR family transcriptional regulator [Desulfurococcales archaeon]